MLRTKATLILVSIVLIIIAIGFITNFVFISRSVKDAMDQDLSMAIDIADNLVSTRIQLIKAKGSIVAERLLKAGSDAEMTEIMASEKINFPEFMSFSVFNRYSGVIAKYGVPIKSAELLSESKYVQIAYNGDSVISTTHTDPETNDFIMHLFVPMSPDMVLIITIPGFTFVDLVRNFRLWETGNYIILDEEGTVVADRQEDLVLNRFNPLRVTPLNPRDREILSMREGLKKILSSEQGTGTFFFNGKENVCIYKRVTLTTAGWYVLVTAPIKESPELIIRHDLIFSSLIFLAIGLVVSLFASQLVIQPYVKIEDRDKLLNNINNISAILIKSETEDFDRTIQLCMGKIAGSMDLDRAHIWKNIKKDGKLFNTKIYEWTITDETQQSIKYNPDESYSENISSWDAILSQGDCINNIVRKMSPEEQAVLSPKGILSTYVVPVFLKDVFWGFIGYDDCHRERLFSENEQSILCSAGLVITSALQRNEIMIELQQASTAKTDFLANMSHEMRTPLNAIIGLSELSLNKNEASTWVLSNLEKIYEAGRTLLTIVNDILDISKIEAGKYEIINNKYALPSLINDAISQNILRIGNKPITFTLDIDADLPNNLYGDELRIKQILNNLLSNAFKYTNEGLVELSIKCEPDTSAQEDNAAWMTVRVRDSGKGLRSYEIDALFVDYSQVNIKDNRKIEGTGLGLSITKKIAELMGGTVSVKSEFGKGSEFTVKIKQKYVDDSVIGNEVVKNLTSFHYSDQKRKMNSMLVRNRMPHANVLVVDDVPTNLDVAKGMLEPYGMHIDCLNSGKKAIEAIRDRKVTYDVIFMDHMMPEVDGIEATRIIRDEIGTDYARNVPIIALTANAIVGNEQIFLKNGFQAFISKPIDVIQLDTILNTWIMRKPDINNLLQTGKDAMNPEITENEGTNSGLFEGIYLKSIDLIQGMDRFNSEDIFLNVINSYYKHTPALLDKLRSFTEETPLTEYTGIAHSLKGSSYGISANIAGNEAAKLESVARAGNREQLNRMKLPFIEMIESLLRDLEKILAKAASRREPKKEAFAPGTELLIRLLEAVREYKAVEMEDIISELESFKYESGSELISWLREKMDFFEYDAIRERLEEENLFMTEV